MADPIIQQPPADAYGPASGSGTVGAAGPTGTVDISEVPASAYGDDPTMQQPPADAYGPADYGTVGLSDTPGYNDINDVSANAYGDMMDGVTADAYGPADYGTVGLSDAAGYNDINDVPASAYGPADYGNGIDPSTGRMGVCGLIPPVPPSAASAPIVHFAEPKDWRVIISLPNNSPLIATNTLLKPLENMGGVVFPYVPTITMSHKANYSQTKLTHSNYASYSYEGSEVSEIGISGDFTVQNSKEGAYLLAAIYFFRSVTKMFFGDTTELAGNPPPLVRLDGFGKYYFPSVLCAVTSFSHTMPNDVDYVEIVADATARPASVGKVRLPTFSSISVTLQPMYSRKHIYQNFNLKQFANGKLLGKGFL